MVRKVSKVSKISKNLYRISRGVGREVARGVNSIHNTQEFIEVSVEKSQSVEDLQQETISIETSTIQQY